MSDYDTLALDDSKSSQPDSSNLVIGEPTVSLESTQSTKGSSVKKEPKPDAFYEILLDKLVLEFNIPDNICKLERNEDKLEASCFVCDQRFLVGNGHKNMNNLKRHLERKSHLNNLERHISSVSSGGPIQVFGSAEKVDVGLICDTTTGGDSSEFEVEEEDDDKVDQTFAKINKRYKNVFQLWREPEWSMSTFECTICQTTLRLFPPGGTAMEHAQKHVSNKSHKAKAKQERALQKQHSKSGFN